jgi:hypothetical protein
MIVGRQVVVAAQHLVAIVHDIATSLAEAAAAESSSYAYRRVHAGRRGDPPIEVARPRLPVRNRAQPRDTRKPTIRHHMCMCICCASSPVSRGCAQQRAGSPSSSSSPSPLPAALRHRTAPPGRAPPIESHRPVASAWQVGCPCRTRVHIILPNRRGLHPHGQRGGPYELAVGAIVRDGMR